MARRIRTGVQRLVYQTRATTQTATATQAKRLASRIGAELLQVQTFYGKPDAETLDKYIAEAEMFLAAGYLRSVRYGFKKGGDVVFEVAYTAQFANGTDDKPGRVPPTADVTGGIWFSYLTYSDAFYGLTREQQQAFKARSPLERETADEPRLAAGVRSAGTKHFSEDELGLYREVRLK